MGFESLFKVFFVQATTITGEGIPGVLVKIYTPLGLDATAQFAGSPNPVTNSQGVVSVYHENPVTAGGIIYTIRLTKRGWQTLEFTTNDSASGAYNFVGYGLFQKQLSKAVSSGDQYEVALPGQYCSPIYPIGFGLTSTSDERDERIITTVSQTLGKSSQIATDISATGEVYIDVHNRIRLKPIPVQVPANLPAVVDHNFSDVVTVEVQAETLDGFLSIPLNTENPELPPTMDLYVANMYPDGKVNDLNSYIPNYVVLSKWITELREPICFVGYYLDVMVWLPGDVENYVLQTTYYDAAGGELEGSDDPIPASQFVYRIRINSAPPDGAERVELIIYNGSVQVTEKLTVRYNYGS